MARMLWIEISSGNWLQCLAVILGQWRAQTGSHQAVTGFGWLSWRESSGRVKSGCRVLSGDSWDMPVTDGGGLLQCNCCDSQPFGRGSYRNWRGRIKEQESAIGGKVTRMTLRLLAETTGLDTVPTSTFGGSQPTKQVHSDSKQCSDACQTRCESPAGINVCSPECWLLTIPANPVLYITSCQF